MRRLTIVFVAIAMVRCASDGKPHTEPVPPKAPVRPIPILLAELSSPNPAARAAAIWELVRVGKVERGVVDALIRARQDDSAPVREAAVWALGLDRAIPYDRPPKLLQARQAKYPQDAFAKKIEGTVVVSILVGESGKVVHAEVLKSIPGLDAAALRCVQQWVFAPALLDGKPIPAIAMAPVSFRIF